MYPYEDYDVDMQILLYFVQRYTQKRLQSNFVFNKELYFMSYHKNDVDIVLL